MPGSQGVLSAVGFHDAEYIGEPNALANPATPAADDWAVTGTGAGSTSVSWAGPAYSGSPAVYGAGANQYQVGTFTAGTGNDHTANVLRWGTLFNFRFTCNSAPATGTVAVGLWRPGTGTSFIMTIPTPGGATSGALTASCCTGTVCSVVTQAVCGAGTWNLPGSTCSPDPCVQGSCCIASTGGCTSTTNATCIGGTWTANAVCSPNPCPQPPTGSCCVPGVGTCSVSTQAACASGSTWLQAGSCTPNICTVASGGCCVASVCSVTTQAACSGTFLGSGSTCSGAVCPSGNDACAAAIPLCASTAVSSTTVGSTFSSVDFNLGATVCGTSGTSPDVWYSYTPATSVSISIDTCTASYDTVLSANTGNCGALTQVQCNDDAGTAAPPSGCGAGNNLHSRITFTATAGTRYLLRVAGYQGGTGTFTITATGGAGTGCNSTGRCCTGTSCAVTTSTACAGTFTAAGTCTGNPCDPAGRCCIGTTCSSTTQSACTGAFTAAGTCSGNPCNPTGACCTGSTCTSTLQSACTGTFTAAGVCTPNPCDPAGRCCIGGNCNLTTQTACLGAFVAAGTCTPNPCPPLTDDCANRSGIPVGSTPFDTTNATTDGPTHALCLASGDNQIAKDVWFNFPCTFDGTIDIDTCGSSFDTKLAVYDGSGCTGFDTRILACNDDSTCAGTAGLQSTIAALPVLCGHHYTIRVGGYTNGTGVVAFGVGTLTITAHPNALGTCCAADGSCAQSQQTCCVGVWAAAGTCTPNSCPQPTGACCSPTSGLCSIATHLACGNASNLYQGDATVCIPNPCPQPSGACCIGTACSITAVGVCNGTFQGSGTVCGTPANPTTCCKANFNQVNGVNVQDIFDFLAGFFAGDPRCDFNGVGGINVQDIFDFLGAWFAGC